MARYTRRYARSGSARRAARPRSRAVSRGRNGVRRTGRSFRALGRRGYARGGVQTVRIVLDNTSQVAPGPEGVGLVKAGMPRRSMF